MAEGALEYLELESQPNKMYPEPNCPVKNQMWNLQWIPILDAEGEKIQIDLDPAPGGKIGQVIDTSCCGYQVLAGSFREFMAQYADDLEAGKYAFDESWNIARINE